MSVLVTGGAGFIGSHTVELLLKEGYEVKILDNLCSGKKENISSILDRVKLIIGDIRDKDVLKNAIKDSQYIIHLAAVVSVDEAIENPIKTFEVNSQATVQLLEFARIFDIDKVVYASSTAVYGEPIDIPLREDHPTRPINPYGAAKLAGESAMEAYNKTYALSTISLRYFNVYGPRMRGGQYAGVISKFLEAARIDEELKIYGDGNQTRDFIHVYDVANANKIALESHEVGVFNIGTGKETKIIDLANLIIRLMESRSRVLFVEPRPGDIYRSVADITKARKILHWEPKISLEEGLKSLIESPR